ncbi:MAG: DUF4349 domain-containing protein, partial [Dehalococcoidia bacterium]
MKGRAMRKVLATLGIAGLVLLLACGGGAAAPAETAFSEPKAAQRGLEVQPGAMDQAEALAPSMPGAPFPPPEIAVEKEMISGVSATPSAASATALETAERKVISMASISVQVELVQPAITEVRVIAESLGGFVEQLTSSGGPQRQRATMTIRVPQDQFFPALERIEALGEVQSRNLGSEDVSERFIDLKARLQSSLREEKSLLSLLERTKTVSEVLAIERELSRVRSEIERFQGQLNFLERRVDLATITVSLIPPEDVVPEPPSASMADATRLPPSSST